MKSLQTGFTLYDVAIAVLAAGMMLGAALKFVI